MIGSLSPAAALSQEGGASAESALQGRIVDSESKAPLSQARIVLVEPDLRTITGDDGRFVFENVAPGAYTIRVTCLGYEPLRLTIRHPAEAPLYLLLIRSAIQLDEITVTPGAFTFSGSNAATRQTMSREDIESVPQIGDDVFRAVNRLPGLASNDYAAHFGVRGGRHDETLILLDGLQLYEPYHLKDFNEGAISIIDAETIDGVELMTGGFPARFGDKRSGVFDITSRAPSADQVRYTVGLSSMNARALASGPIGHGRGAWLAFARGGYMDLVFQLIDQGDLPSPRYEDAFAKMTVSVAPQHTLAVDVLHAGDRYKYDIPETTGFQDSLNTRERAANRYANSYLWSTLTSTLSDNLVVRSMVSAALVTRDRDGAERLVDQVDPLYAISNQRDYSVLGLQQDWTQSFSNRDVLSYGFDLRRLHNTDSYQSLVYKDPNDPTPDTTGAYPVRTNTSIDKRGTRLSLYLSNRWKILEPLVVELGGRYDRASYTGDRDFSPRASAALGLGGGRTLRLGWGIYRQMQGIDDVAALNNDLRYYRSERSEQWTAGLEQILARGTLVRVEAYSKRGSHLRPVFRNWKGAIDAFPESNEDRILVYPKKSTAKGLELYLDRRFGERIVARASYALSKAEEEVTRIESVNSDEPLLYDLSHPNPQDQRHATNVDVTYRFRKRWSLNGSFAYHSGWPSTLENLVPTTNDNGDPDFVVLPVKLYGARLPDYLRLDLRLNRKWSLAQGEARAFLEIINLTNHSNVFGYDYFKKRDGAGGIVLDRGDETWFSIMPSIGIAWSRGF